MGTPTAGLRPTRWRPVGGLPFPQSEGDGTNGSASPGGVRNPTGEPTYAVNGRSNDGYAAMSRTRIAAVFFALSGVAVIVSSIVWKAQLLVSPYAAKLIGPTLVSIGMVLSGLAWLGVGAVPGRVDGVADKLATRGPYRIPDTRCTSVSWETISS